MADTQMSDDRGVSAFDPRCQEMRVLIWHGVCVEYEGSRAHLEAEGIIPNDIQWPRGKEDLRWKLGRYEFWLRRLRPPGARGPKKLWLDSDWWFLRIEPAERQFSWRAVEHYLATRELKKILHAQTAQGQAELCELRARYMAAKRDEQFQAFKALVPGLARPKRRHLPRSVGQCQIGGRS